MLFFDDRIPAHRCLPWRRGLFAVRNVPRSSALFLLPARALPSPRRPPDPPKNPRAVRLRLPQRVTTTLQPWVHGDICECICNGEKSGGSWDLFTPSGPFRGTLLTVPRLFGEMQHAKLFRSRVVTRAGSDGAILVAYYHQQV